MGYTVLWKVQFLSTNCEESTKNKYIYTYWIKYLILESTDAEKKKIEGELWRKSVGCSPLCYHLLTGRCSSAMQFAHGAQMYCVSTP